MLKIKRIFSVLLIFAISTLWFAAFPVAAADTYIIPNDLGGADISNINNSKLTHGATSAPSGWFNVGVTSAAGATSAQYTAPSGGVAAADGGVKLTKAKSGIAHALFTDTQPKTGIYEIKFSVKPNGSAVNVDATGTHELLYNQYSGSTNRRSIILNVKPSGEIHLPQAANPAQNTGNVSWYAGNCNVSDWLDVTAVYNLDAKALAVTVKQNGVTVANMVKNLASIGEDIKNNGLGYIRFNTSTVANGGPVIKNVTARKLNSVSEAEFFGLSANFNQASANGYDKTRVLSPSNATKTTNAFFQSGWFITSASDPTESVDFSTDGYISVASPVTAFGADIKPEWAYRIKGITKYKYRIKASGKGTIRALVLGSGIPATLEFAPGTGRIYANGTNDAPYNQASNSVLLGNYDPEEWLDVVEYMDITSKKWYVKVSQNGKIVANGKELFVRQKLADNGVDTFRFDFTGSEPPTLLADYVQIEKISAIPPEISAETVIITDKDGNELSRDDLVSPLVENIKLDFGTEMPQPSQGEGITLSGGGSSVDFTLAKSGSEGSVWILSPGKLLLPDTEYTLAIPKTVTNTNGASMEEAVEIKFTTAHMDSVFKVLSIRTDNGELTYLNPTHNGKTITIETELLNMQSVDKQLVWYLAYYDINNKFLNIDKASKTIEAQSMTASSDMPTIVLDVPSDTAYARLYLWDDQSLEPYGGAITIENCGVFAEFGKPDTIVGMTAKSATVSELYNGRYGRRLSQTDKNLYLKCDVSDSVMNNLADNTPIEVAVEYFDDAGGGCFSLQYDSHHPDKGLYTTNTAMQQSEIVYLEGTNEWKTKVFHLEDMKMSNGFGGLDFRVAIYNYRGVGYSKTDVVFGSIKVNYAKLLSPIEVSFKTDKLGNIFTDQDATIDITESVKNKASHPMDVVCKTTITNRITGETVYEQPKTLQVGAGETLPFSISIPNDDGYGIYTVKNNISYNDGEGNSGTEKTQSEYAVSAYVDANKTDKDFGYQTQVISLSRGESGEVAQLLSQSGIMLNRDGIQWKTVETEKGVLSLPAGVKDKLVQQQEKGIDNILICSNYNSLYDDGLTPTSDEAIAAYANYCGFLAKELKGVVKYFEIWNEYNHTPFNNNPNAGPETYAKMLKEAYTAIKNANLDALVIGMSTTGVDVDWQEQVYKAGGLSYCDVVSCHPYDWNNEFSPGTLESNLTSLKKLIANYGGTQPIWLTEIGFSTIDKGTVIPNHKSYTGYTQTEQASALVLSRCLVRQKKLADKYIGYCLYDRNNQEDIESCWGLLHYWGSDSGTKPRNGAKESYIAAAAMNKMIGNSECVNYKQQNGSIFNPNYSYAFNFYNSTLGKNVMVIASSLSDRTMNIKLGCNTADVYDMYGNKVKTITSTDGSYTLTAGTVPYYVVGSFTTFN